MTVALYSENATQQPNFNFLTMKTVCRNVPIEGDAIVRKLLQLAVNDQRSSIKSHLDIRVCKAICYGGQVLSSVDVASVVALHAKYDRLAQSHQAPAGIGTGACGATLGDDCCSTLRQAKHSWALLVLLGNSIAADPIGCSPFCSRLGIHATHVGQELRPRAAAYAPCGEPALPASRDRQTLFD